MWCALCFWHIIFALFFLGSFGLWSFGCHFICWRLQLVGFLRNQWWLWVRTWFRYLWLVLHGLWGGFRLFKSYQIQHIFWIRQFLLLLLADKSASFSGSLVGHFLADLLNEPALPNTFLPLFQESAHLEIPRDIQHLGSFHRFFFHFRNFLVTLSLVCLKGQSLERKFKSAHLIQTTVADVVVFHFIYFEN